MARVELLFLLLLLLLGRNTQEVLVSSAPCTTRADSLDDHFRFLPNYHSIFLSSGMEWQRNGQPTMRPRQRRLRIKHGTENWENSHFVRGQW